ncbi:MAG: oligosaccharide flippase family protein [Bacteroidetes bacterium]|nr:oligosaccharide flippase family protein [Bacteroidota bacterium]
MTEASSPKRTVRRVAWQSALYTIGNVAAKAGGLLLALLLWNPQYLPEAHFGVLDAAQNTVGAVVAALLGLGLSSAYLKFIADPNENAQRDDVPFTAFLTASVVAAVALAVLWPLAGWIGATFIVGTDAAVASLRPQAALLARLALVYAALKAVSTIPLMRIQAQERPLVYSLATAGEFAVLLAMSWALMVPGRLGLVGALGALVVAAGAQALVLAGALLARERRRFDARLARRMLRYGAPLVLGALSLPLLHAGDRALLAHLAPAEERTLYAAAVRLASVVNVLLVQGFHAAFAVMGLKALTHGEGADLHRRTFRHLCVFGGGTALGLGLFAQDAIALLAAPGSVYPQATPLVFPLALGYFGYGLYIVGVNALYARAKTRFVALAVAGAAALNLLLNVALYPLVGGAWGATLATLIAYGALAGVVALASERLEGFRFPWGALAAVLAVTTALYAGGMAVRTWDVLPRLAVRTALMGLYPLGVLAFGVYRWAEVRDGLARLQTSLRAR